MKTTEFFIDEIKDLTKEQILKDIKETEESLNKGICWFEKNIDANEESIEKAWIRFRELTSRRAALYLREVEFFIGEDNG